jgi:alpha-ketoglutarate-dependent 2,4-dichlorophenoxyacetate dioxygenase
MALTLRQIGPCFAAEAYGLDLTRPLSPDEVAAIHAGMDEHAVLVFHDQKLDDEAQLAFMKPVRQRLVRTHPATGRKSLYLASHAGGIVGWPVPEARAFLRDLVEHATQRQFVYAHAWRVHDLVMWDNRRTMHRARPFPAHEPRDMRRTTLVGDGPTVAQ